MSEILNYNSQENVPAEPTPSTEVSQLTIEDKQGTQYQLDYHRILRAGEQLPESSTAAIATDFRAVIAAAFPHYTEQFLDTLVAGLPNRSVAVVKNETGEVVSVLSFAKAELTDFGEPAPVMYQHYLATQPELQNRGIIKRALSDILALEQPGVSFGHTGNAGTYLLNQQVAQENGYRFYPQSGDTPSGIAHMGKRMGELFNFSTSIDERLVLTYSTPTSKSSRPFDYFDQDLQLGPNQGVRYLLVKPDLDQMASNEMKV